MDDGDALTIVLIVGAIAFIELLRQRAAYGGGNVPALTPHGLLPTLPRRLLNVLVPMQVSPEGEAFIKGFEQLRLKRYLDAGKPAIGWGHDIKPGENIGQMITATDAENLFRSDIAAVAQALNASIKVEVTQQQFDALASFAYNVGIGAFQTSTLLTMLNNGNVTGAANQFQRWIYSEQKIDPVLQKRRAAEAAMFASAAMS